MYEQTFLLPPPNQAIAVIDLELQWYIITVSPSPGLQLRSRWGQKCKYTPLVWNNFFTTKKQDSVLCSLLTRCPRAPITPASPQRKPSGIPGVGINFYKQLPASWYDYKNPVQMIWNLSHWLYLLFLVFFWGNLYL